ncbi:MAG: phosphatidate cytidylyltransferase [Nitriliruptorales bacterium]|nr:phosphatidate cytidylyltransferase [Nitriliruptorales bacterium]
MAGGRDLPAAIATGVGLAVLFLGSLFWDPIAFTLVVAGLVVTASFEVARVLGGAGIRVATAVLVIGSLVTLGGAHELGHQGQVIGVLTLFFGSVAWLLADAQRHDVVRTLTVTVLLGVWVAVGASFAVLLAVADNGVERVLLVVGAAILTDIGGYAVGSLIGRHKIAPSVSPNKSWEGLIGGLVVAIGLGAIVLPALGDEFTAVEAAIVAGVCGLAGFFGDLTESMVKRDLGIKDLGDLLPGHGGILDRVDGIIVALPVGYFAIELIA